MFLVRSLRKLTNNTYCIGDIWSSVRLSKSISYQGLIFFFVNWNFINKIPSLAFNTIEISTGLHPIIHVSFNKSRVYFLWDTKIPSFDVVTSIPRKYLRFSKSLISNSSLILISIGQFQQCHPQILQYHQHRRSIQQSSQT